MKRWISWAMALCLMLALAGCGAGGPAASSEVGIPSQSAAPPPGAEGMLGASSGDAAPDAGSAADSAQADATGGAEAVALLPSGEEDWQFEAVTAGVPVPEFLTGDQQQLYLAAYYLYYHFSLAGGFHPDQTAQPVQDAAFGEIDYYPDDGFASYADFDAALDAVFTPELKQSLLNAPLYLDHEGSLYSATGARGAAAGYQGEYFLQGTADDDAVSFTLVGQYAEGEEEIPLRMVRTPAGWRFDQFAMAQ